MLQMRVDKVAMEVEGEQSVVILKDIEGKQMLPIWIGMLEATSIALEVEGIKPARPLSHDLMKSIISALGAEVTMVLIYDLKDNTFYGQVLLRAGDDTIEIDARPSDAIALALRTGAPIFVSEKVMEEAGVSAQQDPTVH
ncbi:MAG TPA: bifunctional nuclease family protein [Clostridia bacterium]|nr:bifunctional nuclease family protein [Clostridia bacterium]